MWSPILVLGIVCHSAMNRCLILLVSVVRFSVTWHVHRCFFRDVIALKPNWMAFTTLVHPHTWHRIILRRLSLLKRVLNDLQEVHITYSLTYFEMIVCSSFCLNFPINESLFQGSSEPLVAHSLIKKSITCFWGRLTALQICMKFRRTVFLAVKKERTSGIHNLQDRCSRRWGWSLLSDS